MKILIVMHSLYMHIYEMAKEIAIGAEKIEGTEVEIKRVPELLSNKILEKMGALDAQKVIQEVPEATLSDLEEADAIIFGTGTRFGNMTAQMRSFLDSTGGIWQKGGLIGKVGSVFTSSATQHGGQESTILNFHTTLLHHGMIIVGLPYSFQGQMIIDDVSGASPYGASTITGGDGSRMPSENERRAAQFQGKHVAEITKKMIS
jgi:NAD(P)H dehydrogenase (quinone)